MKPALLILALCIGGCASNAPVTPSKRLVPPPSWAMASVETLPEPKPNEDAKALLGQCRQSFASETSKLQPLQTFARRVTRNTNQ